MKRGKLFIAGHRGMVGGALVRLVERQSQNLEDANWSLITATREELDLFDQAATESFLADQRPDAVIVAAAKVGGIQANASYPAEFLHSNLRIADNLIHGSHRAGVGRLLFLGSSCIYPKLAPQPIPESSLLSGPLEPTNEAYAIAKIAGLKLCEFYRRQYGVCYHSAMPTNLYGPGDNYHPVNSHVIPAMLRRFHEARQSDLAEVVIWGTGSVRREFLHVEDLAEACLLLLEKDDPPDLVNVGTGEDLSILELAELIAGVVGYAGKISPDPTKPEGTPRKLLDVSRIQALGWQARTPLEEGLRTTYQAFLNEMVKN